MSTSDAVMRVLNCTVNETLWRRWEAHFVPARQPFYASAALAAELAYLAWWTREEFAVAGVPLSLKDTFGLYAVDAAAPWVVWLDEVTFDALPLRARVALLEQQQQVGRGGVELLASWQGVSVRDRVVLTRAEAEGRFVWWPSCWRALTLPLRRTVLSRFVREERLPCRREEINGAHWAQLDAALPGVRPLAGRFALESGANCMATVLAALGVASVAAVWLHAGPFERWLTRHTVPAPALSGLGTVLVWRDDKQRVQHAAPSLGEGWVLHKEAQAWFAPSQVVALSDALRRWDDDELHLSAHTRTSMGDTPS